MPSKPGESRNENISGQVPPNPGASPPTRAVVLVSGGMDSLVTAAIALESCETSFLHCTYGQRTEKKELECFHRIADHYGVERRLVVDASHLSKIGGSSLTDVSIDVETADLSRKGIPSSYVPFRNANILSVAVSWAEVIGAQRIYIGAVEEDSSGYPDCRREFFDAFERALTLGTKPGTRIEIVTPVIGMRKSEIVRKGTALNVPFQYTWSCYRALDRACGNCDSCTLRLRGFREAGVTDPLLYVSSG